MPDVPVDSLYTWTALSLAATVLLGIVAGLPTTPPPDAAGVADTVDGVAVAEYAAAADRPLDADAVRLGPRRVGLRNAGGAAHATFAFGPVTPAREGSHLAAVAAGVPPASAFESPAALRTAAVAARRADPSWHAAESLVVRHVRWEGVDVTLVAA